MESQSLNQLCERYSDRLNGGRLSLGLPGVRNDIVDDWIGRSLVWVPESIQVDRPLYTVASSRIGRHPHRRQSWFRLLERSIEASVTDDASMLIANETASAPWVRHACQLFRARATEIRVAGHSIAIDQWLDRLTRSPPEDCVWISPPANGEASNFPRRDMAAIAIASRVFVPLVSKGGNIDRLVKKRLSDQRFDPATVWVAVEHQDRAAQELIAHGAVGWLSRSQPAEADCNAVLSVDDKIGALDELLAARRESGTDESWPYLTHCTRERLGRWPGQSEASYRDEIVLGRNVETGAIGTLKRILRQGRLVGDYRVTRGDDPVVCFTQRPLSGLLSDRVFRSHLGRWDWEPYGISIRQSVLSQLGCRAVVYGDDDLFSKMSDDQKPFFQNQGSQQDWTLEREWRTMGSVDLTKVADDDAFVFVATVEDAVQIAPLCRWPIVVASV